MATLSAGVPGPSGDIVQVLEEGSWNKCGSHSLSGTESRHYIPLLSLSVCFRESRNNEK